MQSLVAGSASAPGSPLVLVHGLLGLAACWRPVMPMLAEGRRVYAPDALGMGESDRVPGLDAGLAASARRLALWMDAEGLRSVDLLGTSHGGAVALRFALDYPERVRSLTVHAPANPFCMGTRPQIKLFSTPTGGRLARWLPFAPVALQSAALCRMYGDVRRLRKGSLGEYVASLRRPGTVDYVVSVLRSWVTDMAVLERDLAGLRGSRMLLLWGELDRAVSLASGYLLARKLGTPLHVLRGLGHLAFEESPAHFAAPVLRFLGEAAASYAGRTA